MVERGLFCVGQLPVRYRLCDEFKLFSANQLSMEPGHHENEFKDKMLGWAANQNISGETAARPQFVGLCTVWPLCCHAGYDSVYSLNDLQTRTLQSQTFSGWRPIQM